MASSCRSGRDKSRALPTSPITRESTAGIPNSVMDGLPSEQQTGQHRVDLSDLVSLIGLEPFAGTVDAGPVAVPDLLVPVTRSNEQVVIPVRMTGNEYCHGFRFVKARQIEEVRVLAKLVGHVVVANRSRSPRGLWRCH